MNIEQFEAGRVSRMLEGFLMIINYIGSLPSRYVARQARLMDKNQAFYIKDHADIERYQRNSIYFISRI